MSILGGPSFHLSCGAVCKFCLWMESFSSVSSENKGKPKLQRLTDFKEM